MHFRPGSGATPRAMKSSAAIDPTDASEPRNASASLNPSPVGHVSVVGNEGPDTTAASKVPHETVGRHVQQAFVGRELLQCTDAAGRADDGDEIPGLDLGIDVFVNRVPHVVHAVEREAEIVHRQGDGPRDSLG